MVLGKSGPSHRLRDRRVLAKVLRRDRRSDAPAAASGLDHPCACGRLPGWMLIFVIKALLPWLGGTDLHLKLGLSIARYGVFVIVFGAWASIMLEVHRYSFTHDLNLSAVRFLISLETSVLFSSFLIAAMWNQCSRHRVPSEAASLSSFVGFRPASKAAFE